MMYIPMMIHKITHSPDLWLKRLDTDEQTNKNEIKVVQTTNKKMLL